MKKNNQEGLPVQAKPKGDMTIKIFIAAAIASVVIGIIVIVSALVIVPAITSKKAGSTSGSDTKTSGSSRVLAVGENIVRYREGKTFSFAPDESGIYIFESSVEEDDTIFTSVFVKESEDGEDILSAALNDGEYASLRGDTKYIVEISPYYYDDEPVEKLSSPVTITITKAPDAPESGTLDPSESGIYSYIIPSDGCYSFSSSSCSLYVSDESMVSVYSDYYDYTYLYVGTYSEGDAVAIEIDEDDSSTGLEIESVSDGYKNAFDTFADKADDGVYVTSSENTYLTYDSSGESYTFNTSSRRYPVSFHYDESGDHLWFAFTAWNSNDGDHLTWYQYN